MSYINIDRQTQSLFFSITYEEKEKERERDKETKKQKRKKKQRRENATLNPRSSVLV